MPFVQRVVQPTYLARPPRPANGAASGSGVSKFQCIPGKCSNNNCINQPTQQQQQQQQQSPANETEAKENDKFNGVARTSTTTTTATTNSANTNNINNNCSLTTTTTTAAIVHQPTDPTVAKSTTQDEADFVVVAHQFNLNLNLSHSHTNGFASSFSYATDNDEESSLPLLHGGAAGVGGESTALLPMKKLKQHVEFLSATSPSSSPARSGFAAGAAEASQIARSQQQQQQHQRQQQSPTGVKIVTGYEFDSISNITLSNALRQLASLVLLASDIFDELQQELQTVGERSRAVQQKIIAVEQRVCAFDPKMVTVPESDLLTFAQRKTHYESDKAARKELFTAETRPRSVKVLYENAGKVSPPPTTASPRSNSFAYDTYDGGVVVDSGTGASQAAGSDELVCTPVFGKANRKMRTRIDAEIEIRLPAAIEDLRKWTSSEALGDVTVTPDCMHHVDTSISTSVVIGDNGILTPALSPSVLSADAVDALYSINVSNAQDNTQIPSDINKDVPLNHRLPSPEEQCKIIALRYPAEVISVDTSGKRFERMCLARKSTTGCVMNIADSNNLNDDVQTVSRRSRSRKVRGKRRNTIAGIDQKEIQDAANGDSTATSSEIKNALAAANAAAEDGEDGIIKRSAEKSKKFGRSKSSDILKKESVALPYDKGKSTLTRLNSLKQWGRNRFRFMQRTEASLAGIADTSGSSQNTTHDKAETTVATPNGVKSTKSTVVAGGGGDIDDECVVHDIIGQKSEGRFSHERKPSYSSSEKSMSVSSSGHLKGKLHLATCGSNVKLRDTSSLNRQRRNGIIANGLASKDEQPHSSSGNWSASSESGRASIGSEITIQPKSSASNTSLNVSSFHPGSGPPSSMLSRRRFLNTSASSSVTSEGTATPDLQVPGDAYNNHLDDETSSAYSCDTEGYYTSFHMDSGLRTLKEEEPPMTPLQHGQTSSYSFGSQSNQTVLSAENEYELYGRGSTSTTTSSAGTVCTTLMVNEHNSLNAILGPDVPERSSSLVNGGKLNRSNHSNSASTSTLERSYSSSTIGSTLERTGTIKRNVNASLKLVATETNENVDSVSKHASSTETPESQEEEFEFEKRLRKRAAQPLPTSSVVAELEYSESSDLEGVERIERIKQKTALNAKRIPSMCIITPSTSDDENQAKDSEAFDPNRTLTNESSPSAKAAVNIETALQFKVNELTGYCTIDVGDVINEAPISPAKGTAQQKDHNLNVLVKRGSQYGFNNMLEKLKVVLPNMKRSPSKSSAQSAAAVVDDDELYDTAGEYVTILDISNNNRHSRLPQPKAASGLGIYYSNDIVRRKLDAAGESSAKGNEPHDQTSKRETTEYISLNELPYHLRRIATNDAAFSTDNKEPINSTSAPRLPNGMRECAESDSGQSVPMYAEITEQRERPLISPVTQNKGARVKLNAQGKFIYDSDSLKRRKGAHTTFAPGPYVKETESALAECKVTAENSESGFNAKTNKLLFLNGSGIVGAARKIANVRPIIATNSSTTMSTTPFPLSGQPTRFNEDQHGAVVYGSYKDNKNQLANHSNPFFQATGPAMLHSPSTKSTSSTGSSTISSSNSANTQASASSTTSSTASAGAANDEETELQTSARSDECRRSSSRYRYISSILVNPSGSIERIQQFPVSKNKAYQRLYKAGEQNATPFQRNTPVYWTLQNRKQPRKDAPVSATCRDDLYATPIRRSERAARAAAVVAAANTAANLSPIVPRNRSSSVGFLTSTPTKFDSQLPGDDMPSKQPMSRSVNWSDNSPERLNTCADRIGQSKTSLMDFKKLLLAKSVKNSPVQKKVSAVELLKKNSNGGATITANNSNSVAKNCASPTPPTQTAAAALNSSMKVLDLSGSPKTFANRRMLRHGQFGSPSKSFAPKPRSSPGGWRGHNVVQRTDIMSTTIPEVNSEEDQSSANSSSSKSCSASEAGDADERLQITAAEKFNLKRNFFLQTEENNFMRGELKKPFAKTHLMSTSLGSNIGGSSNTNQYVAAPLSGNIVTPISYGSSTVVNKSHEVLGAPSTHTMPALETAL